MYLIYFFQAVAKGNSDLVMYLLNHDVQINVKDIYGETPLNEAKRRGFQEIVELFER